jgi:hypothetical protein
MAARFVEGVADEVFHRKKAIIMAFVVGCNYLQSVRHGVQIIVSTVCGEL